ncbi:MAG: galactofuranose transport system ATP-binding protein [Phycisphaerales bacterium]|jgi:simple sugar transport system ATP-binding protein|nr:galactofuranose transport system ATP-binding protein [Phycisphaerales bacterium]
MRAISRSFPGVRALDGVDFTVRAGEIHALMGENGAGKSTLIKVLTGIYPHESGQVIFDGREIKPRSPSHAQSLGVSTVYQEVNLVPTLSVAENFFLGREPRNLLGIKWRQIKRRSRAALEKLNIHIDVSRELGSYSVAIQQMVAIARALDVPATKLLVLDEPTSSLDSGEVKRLFDVMRTLRGQGLGIVFVTHFLDQVYSVSDRITVLRNGRLVGEYPIAELPRAELIGRMMGRDLAAFEKEAAKHETPAPAPAPMAPTPAAAHDGVIDYTGGGPRTQIFLQARGMARKGCIEPFDLTVQEGEIVGLAGLLGSGRTEIARLLFGIDRPSQGQLLIDNQQTYVGSPREAIRRRFGFIPEDRKTQGIIPNLTVRENVILALQSSRGWTKFFSPAKQRAIADKYIKALGIATPDADALVKNLSGGNQQKVILARWLASDPRLLILDEPTRGIDVGAKAEIQKLILALVREGKAILFISSELEEVVRCCDRVAVLRDRVKIGELTGDQINEQTIIRTIAGDAA